MSGDTAVPTPERKIGTVRVAAVAVDTKLTDDQLRRVEALQVARQTLENKPGLFAGSKVEANRAVYDLTYLADWIIAGPADDEPSDATATEEELQSMNWARRQGYVEGVRAAEMISRAGGDADKIGSLLVDDIPPEPTRPYASEVDTYNNPGQDDLGAAAEDHRKARSDADDGV